MPDPSESYAVPDSLFCPCDPVVEMEWLEPAGFSAIITHRQTCPEVVSRNRKRGMPDA